MKVNWFVGGPDVYGVGRKTVEAQRVSIGARPTTVSGEAGRDAIKGLIVVSLRKVAGLTDVMCSPSIKAGAELNGKGGMMKRANAGEQQGRGKGNPFSSNLRRYAYLEFQH